MTSRAAGRRGQALRRPRAILFDWDSTLVDNWRSIEHAINSTRVAMGQRPWSTEETRARVRESMRDSFPRMFGSRWPEARKIFYRAYSEAHLGHLGPLPGAAEMLAALAATGLYLAVVSNKTGALLREEAAHLGWERYFGRLVGAGDAARDKPDPAPIALALLGSGIAAGPEVWFVGDTALDMACAIRAGCLPILLAGEGRGRDDFSTFPPEREVANCQELYALVRQL